MRTTITLSDSVFREAKIEAARRGRTLSALVEEALDAHGKAAGQRQERPRFTTSGTTGGWRREFEGRPVNEVLDALDQAEWLGRLHSPLDDASA